MQTRIVDIADVAEITQYNLYFDALISEMGMVLYNVGRWKTQLKTGANQK